MKPLIHNTVSAFASAASTAIFSVLDFVSAFGPASASVTVFASGSQPLPPPLFSLPPFLPSPLTLPQVQT
jgi:hypothetical protein